MDLCVQMHVYAVCASECTVLLSLYDCPCIMHAMNHSVIVSAYHACTALPMSMIVVSVYYACNVSTMYIRVQVCVCVCTCVHPQCACVYMCVCVHVGLCVCAHVNFCICYQKVTDSPVGQLMSNWQDKPVTDSWSKQHYRATACLQLAHIQLPKKKRKQLSILLAMQNPGLCAYMITSHEDS